MGAKKTVIVIGGGFAGLAATKVLVNHSEVNVHLFDKRNHHLFQPLLYQVAAGGLNPSDIAYPIRSQFSRAENVQVHLDEISKIDLEKKMIQTMGMGKAQTFFGFDYLVVACGAHSIVILVIPIGGPFAPGLKNLEQAIEIRRRILSAFESAETEADPEIQKNWMTFVVVGGGPTGVEVAGAIAEISRSVLVEDFNRIDPAKAQVILVEAGPRILSAFPVNLSAHAEQDLQEIGVEVMLGRAVKLINDEGVQIGDQFLKAKTVIWGAGVQAAKMEFHPEVACDRAGKIKVKKDFSLPLYPDVFVVGDMASLEIAPEVFLPGLAPAAIQSGKYVGKIILSTLGGQARTNFVYKDKGIMATIGKKKAIVQRGKLQMTGFLAWMAWFFVHIYYLVGVKNKFAVMMNWSWNYLFSKRGARLITSSKWEV